MSYSQEKFENDIYEEITLANVFNEVAKGNNFSISTENMPMELYGILSKVERENFVVENIEELIFVAKLENRDKDWESESFIPEFKTRGIVLLSPFRKNLIPKDEIDLFEVVVYEAGKIEGRLEGKANSDLEKFALKKRLKVLEDAKGLELNLKSGNYFHYVRRIKAVREKLKLLNRS